MIRNRNIASDAQIDPGKIAGGFGNFGQFRIIRVCKAAAGNYSWLQQHTDSSLLFNTITEAMTASQEDDVIYVHRGGVVYEEGAVLNFTKEGVKLLGQMTSGSQWGMPSIHCHGTSTHCITINANCVEIAGVGIHQQTANAGIRVGTTANTWRTHIHDVYFGGNSTGTYGLVMGDTTAGGGAYGVTIDAPCTVVERCHFQDWATNDIFMNAGYGSIVKDCNIVVDGNAIGIQYYTDGTSRPDAYIQDNVFNAHSASTSTGISITNTPTVGYLSITRNMFHGFGSAALACSKRTAGYLNENYLDGTVIANA